MLKIYKKELDKICKSHNITLECLMARRRLPELKKAKVECQCFLRHKGLPYEAIAIIFWYKSHYSIMYNVKNSPYRHMLNYVN